MFLKKCVTSLLKYNNEACKLEIICSNVDKTELNKTNAKIF
jgi:hypothetical protein